MKIKLENNKLAIFVFPILFSLFIIFLWKMHVEYYHLQIAWSGFSPIGWLAERNFPENFQRGFPAGLVGHYEKSIFMHIYILTNKFIPTILMTKVMMLLEIILLYVLAYFYAKKLSTSNNLLFKTFIVGTLLAFSYSRCCNFGRWGVPAISGQFYNIADFLRGMAFLMYLESKFIQSSIYSAICVCTHPLMGLIGFFANIVSLIPVYRNINIKKLALGILIISSITIIWYLLFFKTSTIYSSGISSKEWFFMARLLSYHWFPDSLGVLTTWAQDYIMPFLSFSVLLFFLIKNTVAVQKYLYQFVFAYISIMFLVIIGILNAHFEWSILITKMALQRSNEFLFLIGVLVIVPLLVDQLESSLSILKASIVIIILGLFFRNFQWLPSIVLFYLFIFNWPNWKTPIFISTFFLGLYLLYMMCGVSFSVLFIFNNLLIFIVVMAISTIAMYFLGTKKNYIIILLSILSGAAAFHYVAENRISLASRELYQDFYNAQIWAKNNTSIKALFVVDPGICYGWRDYSLRSSLGNVREWLHISILYDSNKEIYENGKKIFNNLGINLNKYIEPTRWTYTDKMNEFYREVEKNFYLKGGIVNIAHSLAKQKDIFYVLLKKKVSCVLPSTYENNNILIVEQDNILNLYNEKCMVN